MGALDEEGSNAPLLTSYCPHTHTLSHPTIGADGSGDGSGNGDGIDWAASRSNMMKDFNAKQIAELTMLFTAYAEAKAKLVACRSALELVEYDCDERQDDLRERLASMGPSWIRAAALAFRSQIENISLTRRTPADKVMVFRLRDMAHMRSITIARFWLAGTSCTEKMEAMSIFVFAMLDHVLRRELDGEVIAILRMFVADKENCNKFEWGGNGGLHASSTQHAARSTQHAARSTQHTAHSTQHAARSTQHAARSTQHAARSTHINIYT